MIPIYPSAYRLQPGLDILDNPLEGTAGEELMPKETIIDELI